MSVIRKSAWLGCNCVQGYGLKGAPVYSDHKIRSALLACYSNMSQVTEEMPERLAPVLVLKSEDERKVGMSIAKIMNLAPLFQKALVLADKANREASSLNGEQKEYREPLNFVPHSQPPRENYQSVPPPIDYECFICEQLNIAAEEKEVAEGRSGELPWIKCNKCKLAGNLRQ